MPRQGTIGELDMNAGAQFAIIVDGKIVSHRDLQKTALDAAHFAKEQQPNSEVAVQDLRKGTVIPVIARG